MYYLCTYTRLFLAIRGKKRNLLNTNIYIYNLKFYKHKCIDEIILLFSR